MPLPPPAVLALRVPAVLIPRRKAVVNMLNQLWHLANTANAMCPRLQVLVVNFTSLDFHGPELA
jgi:hypothetical protein